MFVIDGAIVGAHRFSVADDETGELRGALSAAFLESSNPAYFKRVYVILYDFDFYTEDGEPVFEELKGAAVDWFGADRVVSVVDMRAV